MADVLRDERFNSPSGHQRGLIWCPDDDALERARRAGLVGPDQTVLVQGQGRDAVRWSVTRGAQPDAELSDFICLVVVVGLTLLEEGLHSVAEHCCPEVRNRTFLLFLAGERDLARPDGDERRSAQLKHEADDLQFLPPLVVQERGEQRQVLERVFREFDELGLRSTKLQTARRARRDAEQEARRLLRLSIRFNAGKGVQSAEALRAALALSRGGRRSIERLVEARTETSWSARQCRQAEAGLAQLASDLEAGVRRNESIVPYADSLGSGLATGHQRALDAVESLAAGLRASRADSGRQLARRLEERLRKKRPVLALAGPFSSGKTTLLNALLMGDRSARKLKTSTRANTGMVLELHSAERDEDEACRAEPREHVDHVLITPGRRLTHHRALAALLELLECPGLLTQPALIHDRPADDEPKVRVPRDGIYKPAAIRREIQRLLQAAREGGEPRGEPALRFRATIDREILSRTPPFGPLFQWRPLTDEIWSELFGGNGPGGRPLVEGEDVGLLFERVELRLHHPLLRLTSLADTPGVGSRNDRHEILTECYLQQADGFLVLLPSRQREHSRVQQMLSMLADELRRRLADGSGVGHRLSAFVVNCHHADGSGGAVARETIHRKAIEEYDKRLKDTLGCSDIGAGGGPSYGLFAVDLSAVSLEGADPEVLYERASMAPLRRWLDELLSNGAYRSQWEGFRACIDSEWESQLNELARRQRQQKRERWNKEGERTKLKRKVTQLEESLANLRDREDEAELGLAQRRIRGHWARLLKRPTEDGLEQAVIYTRGVFDDLNELLNGLPEPSEAWDEVQDALGSIPGTAEFLDEVLAVLRGPREEPSKARLKPGTLQKKGREARDEWPGRLVRLVPVVAARAKRRVVRDLSDWVSDYLKKLLKPAKKAVGTVRADCERALEMLRTNAPRGVASGSTRTASEEKRNAAAEVEALEALGDQRERCRMLIARILKESN